MDNSQNAVQHRLPWSAPAGPNEETSYDHVIAPTPFGRIRITWKGWKEYDSPTVDEHPVPDFFYPGYDLDDAKTQAEKAFFDAVEASMLIGK